MSLIVSTTGLMYGEGLQFQTPIGGAGLAGEAQADPEPPAQADMVAWYRGDSLVDGSGGVASSWQDKTASDYDLSPSGSPTIVDSGLNGRLAARFVRASSQTFTRSSTPSQSQPFTVAVVGKCTAIAGGSRNLFCSDGGFVLGTYDGTSTQVGMYAGGASGVSGTTGIGDFHLFEFTFNGGSSRLAVDNVQEGTGDPGGNGLSGFRIGSVPGPADYLDGEIAEVVIWDKVLNSTELDELWTYVQAYYGL